MMQSLQYDGKQYADPVLRRILVHHVQQGAVRQGRPDHARAAHLGRDLRPGREAQEGAGRRVRRHDHARRMPGWGYERARPSSRWSTRSAASSTTWTGTPPWTPRSSARRGRCTRRILRDAGQKDILSYSYNECIALMETGKCGMYYDATSICSGFEAPMAARSRARSSYVAAPHEVKTTNTSWLWNWAMGINPKSDKKQEVFDFILWATSKDFINLTLEKGSVPAPPRRRRPAPRCTRCPPTRTCPNAKATLAALQSMDFNNPCVNPGAVSRPAVHRRSPSSPTWAIR